MIIEPADQFAVADSAMRLDPFSLFLDRFAFPPEQAQPREQSPVEEHAVSENQQVARGDGNQQAQVQTSGDIFCAHEKAILDGMPIDLVRELPEALRSHSPHMPGHGLRHV